MFNLDHVKLMFNDGCLTVSAAMFIHKQGYSVICGNGQVEQVLKESDD